MGSLFTALRNTGLSMRVYERAIGVVQGNVANASTPGYARQQQALAAMRFDLDNGLPGGVTSAGTIDSRSEFADRIVRQRLQSAGEAGERTTQLTRLEPVFDIADESGLNAALGRFFQSASALTIAPNDTSARKVLLDRAAEVAGSFNAVANGLSSARLSLNQAFEEKTGLVNQLAGDIASINAQFRNDFRAQNDPGLQSRLNNLLEDLSDVVDITVLRGDDGSATVYLGGEALLVIGDRQYAVSADTGGGQARLLDWEGNDISGKVHGGRIAALLELNNTTLPGYQARMDRMAEEFADQVNTVLSGGVDLGGNPPAVNLFGYDPALGAARTLQVGALTPAELALAAPASPGGNDVALQLAGLSKAPAVDGFTFSQYYGSLAADAGRTLGSSREDQRTQENLLSQATRLRDDAQSVDLNEEALVLLQYQRAYEAAAKLVRTLDEMTQTVLGLIR
jgi:flagellar hook-associated protein 1 FlgK